MSAVVESVFSLAGLIDTHLRTRMSPERFEKLFVDLMRRPPATAAK